MDMVGGFGQRTDELDGDVGDTGEPYVLAHRPHPPTRGIGTTRLAGERAVEVLAVGVAHDQTGGLGVESLAVEGHRQACRVETTDQRGGPGAGIVAGGVQEQMAPCRGERLVESPLGELDARRTAHLSLPPRCDAGCARESVDVRPRERIAGGSGDARIRRWERRASGRRT